MARRTVAIISFSPLGSDPRVDRQIRFLGDSYDVTAIGYGEPASRVRRAVPIPPPVPSPIMGKFGKALQILAGRYEEYYWGQDHVAHALRCLSGTSFDLVIANDILALPLAIRLSSGAKVMFDAHEYAPKEFEDRFLWRLFSRRYVRYLCDTYVPKADGMTTVCQGIADAYETDTGVKPSVVTNAPFFVDQEPDLDRGEKGPVRLIHHGAAIASRKIEGMIRMMDYLDARFELNLMLVESTPGYVDRLKSIAGRKENIRFLEPVSMPEIPKVLNRFDVGVFVLEPVNFNYLHALPNKIFEFIQGRLAIAVGPSPEMARIVRENSLGVVAEDFSPRAMARALGRLDGATINRYKRNSHEAARRFCAERNREKFLGLVRKLLDG